MKTLVTNMGIKKIGTIIAFVLLIALMVTAFASISSTVYGVGPDEVEMKFYNYGGGTSKGELIERQVVSRGAVATAPADPSIPGLTFEGWDTPLLAPTDAGIDTVDVVAVYSVKTTMSTEPEGSLAPVETALPAALHGTTGSSIEVGSDVEVSTLKVIGGKEVPLISGEKPEPDSMFMIQIVLVVLASIVLIALVGYTVYALRKKPTDIV